jgi:antitoxin MazE
MIMQISRWGNSLALRIPNAFAKEAALDEGRRVEMKVIDGTLVIAPVDEVPRFDLQDLIAGISPENIPDEGDFVEAAPVGKESW